MFALNFRQAPPRLTSTILVRVLVCALFGALYDSECQVSPYNFSGKLVLRSVASLTRLSTKLRATHQLDHSSRTFAASISDVHERDCLIKSRGSGIPRHVHEVTNSGLTTEVKGRPGKERRARKVKEPWRKGREPKRKTPDDRRKD